MYGLINKAVRGLVLDQFGADAWQRIRQAAGVDDEDFIAMDNYGDEVTYKLVEAAAVELELEPEQVLQAFGEYWVDYVADENYGHLMQTAGQSFPEFLANLDQMHARVKLTFPNLEPPSFSVTDQTENSLRLHYYSSRQGLGPLVVGLLHGLGRRFDTSVKVESGRDGEGSEAHDVFDVEFHAAVVDQS
ncbi:MAG: heme NO-binding domain-containing protein [Phycisphaerales bacterium]|nr:heme NO-binding domain-containing protein [Phycisphaerales bacterium]